MRATASVQARWKAVIKNILLDQPGERGGEWSTRGGNRSGRALWGEGGASVPDPYPTRQQPPTSQPQPQLPPVQQPKAQQLQSQKQPQGQWPLLGSSGGGTRDSPPNGSGIDPPLWLSACGFGGKSVRKGIPLLKGALQMYSLGRQVVA